MARLLSLPISARLALWYALTLLLLLSAFAVFCYIGFHAAAHRSFDRHLVHEVTSPQAFEGLRMTGRSVRAPDKTIAVPDHNVPTTEGRDKLIENEESRIQVEALDKNARDFGVNYYPVSDIRQGIVHIVGPEQGWTLSGIMTH